MGEHRSRDEGILQCLKSKMTIIIKIPQSSLLGEACQLEYLLNMLLMVSHVVGKD